MSGSNSLSINSGLPLVAIVGRPNVGKSTLFNRLIRKRRSITDPTPGVTRDVIAETWMLEGSLVTLVDTGGVTARGEGFDDAVTERSRSLLASADVIILLLDVHELTPEDEMLIEWVRPYADKLVAAVNKVDHENHEKMMWDLYRFGFDLIIPLSAEHGRGVDELAEAVAGKIDFTVDREPAAAPPEDVRIAVMGKPNTGKSTLVNRLLGSDAAIISEIPGTTRDVVSGVFTYQDRTYRILDTAGLRRKRKVHENVEYYSVNRAVRSIEEVDIVLLLIDAKEGLVDQDKKIASLITEKGKGVFLVLNKWDLMDRTPNQLRAVRDRVRYLFPMLGFAPILPISGKEGSGIPALMKSVEEIYEQLNRRVDTSLINSAVRRWVEQNEPPRSSRGRYKIFYATQISSSPVEFLLFVNRTEGFPSGYVGYITNGIRRELGFDKVPVRVSLRERRRRE